MITEPVDLLDIAGPYAGKSVLVTGAGGFVGSRLVERLAGLRCRIVRLGHGELPDRPKGPAVIKDLWGDIADERTWHDVIGGIDVVFHLASQTSAYAAANDPLRDFRVNAEGTLHLLEAIRQGGSRAFVVFAGTIIEAQLTEAGPIDETAPDQPITAYGLSKLTAENYLKLYCGEGWARGTSLRLASVYGPNRGAPSSRRGVLNAVILRAMNGDPVFVYGSGDYVRDYIYIDDVVAAFLLAGRDGEGLNGRHFVIGSGQGIVLKDAFALAVERVHAKTGRTAPLEFVDPPQDVLSIDAQNFVANTDAFNNATGWRATWLLSRGIDRTIDAYLGMLQAP